MLINYTPTTEKPRQTNQMPAIYRAERYDKIETWMLNMICPIGAWYESFVPHCPCHVFSSFLSENAWLYWIYISVKVHLTPKFFFTKTNLDFIWSIWAKKFLNLVESSIFYALSKSRLSVSRPRFRESGAAVPDDVYPGTKHNSASVNSLYLLEKIECKTNRTDVFWD